MTRQRLRQVSPERIAKVAAALGDRVRGVRLGPDGSAVILTSDGVEDVAWPRETGSSEWDDADLGRI